MVERDLCTLTFHPEGQKETSKDVLRKVLEDPVPFVFIIYSVSGPNTGKRENLRHRTGGNCSTTIFEKQSEKH